MTLIRCKALMKTPSGLSTPDPRHLSRGREIPTESYSDQPFIVKTGDGAWLCCVTTGSGPEGVQGQHVTTLRNGTTRKPGYLKPYAQKYLFDPENQRAPAHFHRSKREDICCLAGGNILVQLRTAGPDDRPLDEPLAAAVDGITRTEDNTGRCLVGLAFRVPFCHAATMKTLFPAGLRGQVSVPLEKRFLIPPSLVYP